MKPGDYIIARSSQSGCWAGTLAGLDGDTVTLTNARRLWRWWAAEGVSLSGVAAAGLHIDHLNECRIATPVTEVIVFGVCELLATTLTAQKSITAAKVSNE